VLGVLRGLLPTVVSYRLNHPGRVSSGLQPTPPWISVREHIPYLISTVKQMSSESSPEPEVIRQYLSSRKSPTSNTNQQPESQTELVRLLALAVKSHKRNDGINRPEIATTLEGLHLNIRNINGTNGSGGTKNLTGYAKTTELSCARPTRKFLRTNSMNAREPTR
jgi:hypothetical protein